MSSVATRRLGEVATILRGTVPAKPTTSNDGVPFFGIAEISAGGVATVRRVDLDDALTVDGRRSTAAHGRHVVLEAGDVAVALMGNIGQSALVTARHSGAVLGRECASIRPAGPEVSRAWIYVWTQSARFRDQALRHTSGTTMPRLSYRALPDFSIPVPQAGRQQEAERLLEDFDGALGELEQVRSYLTELRTLQMELILADLEGGE